MATLEQLDLTLNRVEALANDILLKLQLPGMAVHVPGGLADISEDLGLVKAGEFRSGKGEPGHGFTGVRVGAPGWAYDSGRYAITGINNDVLQFGLSVDDGKIYASGGNIWLDQDGLHLKAVSDLTNWGNALHFRDGDAEVGQIGYGIEEFFPWRTLYVQLNTDDPAYNNWTRVGAIVQTGNAGVVELYGVSGAVDASLILAASDASGNYLLLDGAPMTTSNGIAVGYSTTTDSGDDLLVKNDVVHEGALVSKKGGVEHTGYAFTPYIPPKTSTSWDGDAKTTANNGTIDLSAVFGVPANIKAVSVRLEFKDETPNIFCSLGPDSTYFYAVGQLTEVANQKIDVCGIVPCDANGDIYFYCQDELDLVSIEIWGYFI